MYGQAYPEKKIILPKASKMYVLKKNDCCGVTGIRIKYMHLQVGGRMCGFYTLGLSTYVQLVRLQETMQT